MPLNLLRILIALLAFGITLGPAPRLTLAYAPVVALATVIPMDGGD